MPFLLLAKGNKGKTQGVLVALHRPLPSFPTDEFLITIGGQLSIAIDNITMFEELNRSHIELTLAYDTTIDGWAQALSSETEKLKDTPEEWLS